MFVVFMGAGGGVDFHILLFLIKENVSYQELFTEWKTLFLAKVIAFLNLENTASANLITIPRKSILKSIIYKF